MQIKATLEGLTGVRAARQVLFGDRVHVSHDQVCTRLRSGSIQPRAYALLNHQQTLASAGVVRGTTLVMAEKEPDARAPHANMFGALRPEVCFMRVFAISHLRATLTRHFACRMQAGSEAEEEEEEEDEEYVVNSDSMESENEDYVDDDVYYDDADVDGDFGQDITARRPSVDPLST